jgi:ech hydrogenase subunit A
MKVLGRQSTARLAAPYIGGLPSSAPGSYVGPLGRNWPLFEGNEYATEIFGEPKLTKIAGILAGALLLALVGGALI